MWNCGNFHKPTSFCYSERSTRGCVDDPKCNSKFLAMVTLMKHLFFFFFHIMQNKFNIRHIPRMVHEPWQSLQVYMNFNHMGVVLILYHKCRHLIIHFNLGALHILQGIPSDHISRGHLIEHSPSIIHAPTFCIHVDQATPHKDIRLATTLNDLCMSTPALFEGIYAGTCIQHRHKSKRVRLHIFLLHLLK